jgi:Flp pilus assembly protein TadD
LPIDDLKSEIDKRLAHRKFAISNRKFHVSVAQLDRAADFGSAGWGFKSLQARILIGVIAAGVIAAFGWLAYKCARDPEINFLSGDNRAEWILFPSAVTARTHPVATIDATFRRTFGLLSTPQSARLEVRAAKRLDLKINDQSIPLIPPSNWKDSSILDVAKLLRAGDNTIEARVFNDDAPPALWLTLSTDSSILRSDQTWEASIAGSSWRSCALASVPRKPGAGNFLAGGERIRDVLSKVSRAWVLFGILAALGVFTLNRWIKDDVDLSRAQLCAFIGLCVLAWVALFWNNARLLPFHSGYDVTDHVAYIKYIQDRGALPLPNEGYEMFQPPLFYAIAASALSIFHLSTADPAAVPVLRGLALISGIANFIFVFLSARLVFPRRATAQLIALTTAAFLPMQLYLSHYVTNEVFAASLATMSIYFGLRVLITDRASFWLLVTLGVCVGAAMLAKATTLLILPALLGAFAIKLLQQRAAISDWSRTFGITIAAIFLTCGWHYIRIWKNFGTPIVGNWDPILGFPWWQDPGFHTTADYFRFGQAVVAPMFSGFNGFADGIFSTLWGDSLGGGLSGVLARTPWNYSLMIGGYWLAIVPTSLVAIGFVIALCQFARRVSAEWFFLLAVSSTILVAVIFMTLKVASYAQVKAFYGLAALVPFCVFVAIGWQDLTARSRILRSIVTALLFLISINSFASVWIRPSSEQHIYNAARLIVQSEADHALAEAKAAVRENPSSANAHYVLAAIFDDLGDTSNALNECLACSNLDPTNADCQLQCAIINSKQVNFSDPMQSAQDVLKLQPENLRAYTLALSTARGRNDSGKALDIGRDAIAVFPYDPDLHYRIGLAAGELNDFKTATEQFTYAFLLAPKKPEHEEKLRVAVSLLARNAKAPAVIGALQPLAAESPKLLEIFAPYRQNPNSTQPDRP